MEKLLQRKGLDMNIIFNIQSFMIDKKDYEQVINQFKDGDIYQLCTTNLIYTRDMSVNFVRYKRRYIWWPPIRGMSYIILYDNIEYK
tara:strand:- start:402 stop:662 length:261 start_codon:yes stop_codon:yes gene_type:complete